VYKDVSGYIGSHDPKALRRMSPALVPGLEAVRIVSICAGENHDLALSDSGDVYEFGDTRLAARGSDRNKTSKLTPRRVAVRDKGAKGQAVKKFVAVWACGMSNFVKSADGRVFAWGLNNYGQLGINSRYVVAGLTA
jgi:regulator of chromosome condensation